jgi:hypothetical protein
VIWLTGISSKMVLSMILLNENIFQPLDQSLKGQCTLLTNTTIFYILTQKVQMVTEEGAQLPVTYLVE